MEDQLTDLIQSMSCDPISLFVNAPARSLPKLNQWPTIEAEACILEHMQLGQEASVRVNPGSSTEVLGRIADGLVVQLFKLSRVYKQRFRSSTGRRQSLR